jgi:hypothetical protein
MTFSRDNLWLVLRPSGLHGILLFAVHLAAGYALFANPLWRPEMAVALSFGVLTSLIYALHRQVFLAHPQSVRELNYHKGNWQLGLKSGERVPATLRFPVYVGSWFVVVLFMSRGMTMPVVITADSVGADTYRRVRVFLRFALTVSPE